MDSLDKALHAQALGEIATNTMDTGVFAKALSESGGEKNLTQSLYIKYRVADLRDEAMLKERQNAEIQKERVKQEKRDNLKAQVIADRTETERLRVEAELRKKQWKADHPYAPLIFYTFVISAAIIFSIMYFLAIPN
jgi:hypothetical protein